MMKKEEALAHIKENCGDGWLTLVEIIFDNKPDHINIDVVFQKWGGLKVDYEGEDEDFESLCDAIYSLSQKMCETCGRSGGYTVIDGWETTLCDEHYRASDARQKSRPGEAQQNTK